MIPVAGGIAGGAIVISGLFGGRRRKRRARAEAQRAAEEFEKACADIILAGVANVSGEFPLTLGKELRYILTANELELATMVRLGEDADGRVIYKCKEFTEPIFVMKHTDDTLRKLQTTILGEPPRAI
jgi:hypothetical protein